MQQPTSQGKNAREESELLAGARPVAQAGEQALGRDLQDAGSAVVWVRAPPTAVNDTPDPLEPYTAAELDGAPLRSRGNEPTRCLMCGRLFDGTKAWSDLFVHQGRPCQPPETPESPHPVRVSFSGWREPHVRGVLAANGLVLEDEVPRDACSFLVDLSLLQRTLRQLAFAEASAYNLERWYDALRAHTAETTTVLLSDAELTMMQTLHAAWHVGHGHSVDDATLEVHAALERRLQEGGWGDASGGEQGASVGASAQRFVKTSMRSPKDAVKVELVQGMPAHERLRREVEACAVADGAAALEMLVASKRVMSDVSHFRRYRVAGASEEFNVVLRRWDVAVAGSVEWRCFVAEGRLTAISQYHCYTPLPEVAGASAEGLRATRDRLVDFQRRVHGAVLESVKVPSYVLDVATRVGGDEDVPVRLVEVNPLHASGAALFTWRLDAELLLRGRADGAVELRVMQ